MKNTLKKLTIAGLLFTGLSPLGHTEAILANEQAEVYEEYTVVAGDSLYGIANPRGISVEELQALNGLDSTLIHPGQVLKVPTTNDEEPEAPVEESGEYVVQAGDTLINIANHYGVSLDALMEANGLTSSFIQVGQVLVIPNGEVVEEEPEEEPEQEQTEVHQYLATVEEGESLLDVANRTGVSVHRLIKLNALQEKTVYPGQQLVIYNPEIEEEPVEEEPVEEEPVDPGYTKATQYTVQAGDTLYGIANYYGISVDDIMEANDLSSDFLSIGQTLIIPVFS